MSNYVADGDKQVPGSLPDNAYDRAVTPGRCSGSKTPNSVIIGEVTNRIGFFFGNSASFAAAKTSEGPFSVAANVVTGSGHYVEYGSPADGSQYNIHPYAYSSSLADSGKVVFVYNSGLSTGGR